MELQKLDKVHRVRQLQCEERESVYILSVLEMFENNIIIVKTVLPRTECVYISVHCVQEEVLIEEQKKEKLS